ncbi:hypothetical protein CR513_14225, partial [Mucuna pruriens]
MIMLIKLKCPQEYGRSTQAPNLRPNSLQEGKDDAYMEGHGHIPHEGFKEEETPAFEGLMTRGRLKKLQGKDLVSTHEDIEEEQEEKVINRLPTGNIIQNAARS